jgi:hypothetical protein
LGEIFGPELEKVGSEVCVVGVESVMDRLYVCGDVQTAVMKCEDDGMD